MVSVLELIELKKKAIICMGKHMQALGGEWEYGEPWRAWHDENGYFYVEYQFKGAVFCYKEEPDGSLKWW